MSENTEYTKKRRSLERLEVNSFKRMSVPISWINKQVFDDLEFSIDCLSDLLPVVTSVLREAESARMSFQSILDDIVGFVEVSTLETSKHETFVSNEMKSLTDAIYGICQLVNKFRRMKRKCTYMLVDLAILKDSLETKIHQYHWKKKAYIKDLKSIYLSNELVEHSMEYTKVVGMTMFKAQSRAQAMHTHILSAKRITDYICDALQKTHIVTEKTYEDMRGKKSLIKNVKSVVLISKLENNTNAAYLTSSSEQLIMKYEEIMYKNQEDRQLIENVLSEVVSNLNIS